MPTAKKVPAGAKTGVKSKVMSRANPSPRKPVAKKSAAKAVTAKASVVKKQVRKKMAVVKAPLDAVSPAPAEEVVPAFTQDIRLVVSDEASHTAFMPFRWCCEPELLKRLGKKEVEGRAFMPHILILVGRCDEDGQFHEESRIARPLTDQLAYVMFRGSGKYTVVATIVYCREYHLGWELRRALNKKSSASVDYSLKRRSVEDAVSIGDNDIRHMGGGSVEVEVSAEFFAPEPPRWLQKWANLTYRTGPVDQCDFRRRVLRSIFVQPITLPLRLALRVAIFIVVSTLLFLIGSRDYPTDLVRRPFSLGIGDCLGDDLDLWWRCHEYDVPLWKRFAWFLTMPAAFLIFTSATIYLSVKVYSCLMPIIGNVAMLAVCLGFLVAVGAVGFKFADWVITRATGLDREERRKLKIETAKKSEELIKQAQQEARQRELAALTCEIMPFEANVSALPRERQTFRLRFLNLKAKVCRPYARQ